MRWALLFNSLIETSFCAHSLLWHGGKQIRNFCSWWEQGSNICFCQILSDSSAKGRSSTGKKRWGKMDEVGQPKILLWVRARFNRNTLNWPWTLECQLRELLLWFQNYCGYFNVTKADELETQHFPLPSHWPPSVSTPGHSTHASFSSKLV